MVEATTTACDTTRCSTQASIGGVQATTWTSTARQCRELEGRWSLAAYPLRGRRTCPVRGWLGSLLGMPSRVANFCVDASDPVAQAQWWEQVLDDFHIVPEGTMNDDEAELRGPGGRWLEFLKVPDSKTVKNRMHMCLRPVNTTRDAEVERILALGATVVDDRRELDDGGWVVFGDPEGNEFCLLARSADEAGIGGNHTGARRARHLPSGRAPRTDERVTLSLDGTKATH